MHGLFLLNREACELSTRPSHKLQQWPQSSIKFMLSCNRLTIPFVLFTTDLSFHPKKTRSNTWPIFSCCFETGSFDYIFVPNPSVSNGQRHLTWLHFHQPWRPHVCKGLNTAEISWTLARRSGHAAVGRQLHRARSLSRYVLVGRR